MRSQFGHVDLEMGAFKFWWHHVLAHKLRQTGPDCNMLALWPKVLNHGCVLMTCRPHIHIYHVNDEAIVRIQDQHSQGGPLTTSSEVHKPSIGQAVEDETAA